MLAGLGIGSNPRSTVDARLWKEEGAKLCVSSEPAEAPLLTETARARLAIQTPGIKPHDIDAGVGMRGNGGDGIDHLPVNRQTHRVRRSA